MCNCITQIEWKPHALDGEVSSCIGDKKCSFFCLLWRQGKVETQAKDLIIWAKDEGKEMGFQSFTFTIIL